MAEQTNRNPSAPDDPALAEKITAVFGSIAARELAKVPGTAQEETISKQNIGNSKGVAYNRKRRTIDVSKGADAMSVIAVLRFLDDARDKFSDNTITLILNNVTFSEATGAAVYKTIRALHSRVTTVSRQPQASMKSLTFTI